MPEIEAGPPGTVPLICEFRTNDPGIADMLNMIEAIPRYTFEREEMLGVLHAEMARLCFLRAGEYRARDKDQEIRRKRRESRE